MIREKPEISDYYIKEKLEDILIIFQSLRINRLNLIIYLYDKISPEINKRSPFFSLIELTREIFFL